MTRKDFVLIADAIQLQHRIANAAANEVERKAELSAVKGVAEEIADALARTNDRFDRERFLKACGVQS